MQYRLNDSTQNQVAIRCWTIMNVCYYTNINNTLSLFRASQAVSGYTAAAWYKMSRELIPVAIELETLLAESWRFYDAQRSKARMIPAPKIAIALVRIRHSQRHNTEWLTAGGLPIWAPVQPRSNSHSSSFMETSGNWWSHLGCTKWLHLLHLLHRKDVLCSFAT